MIVKGWSNSNIFKLWIIIALLKSICLWCEVQWEFWCIDGKWAPRDQWDSATYITVLLAFFIFFIIAWLWGCRFLIRSKRIKRILGFAIKRRHDIRLRRLKFDDVSSFNQSINENTFDDFFRIDSDFRVNRDKKKAGFVFRDPWYTITTLNVTTDEYYYICTNRYK